MSQRAKPISRHARQAQSPRSRQSPRRSRWGWWQAVRIGRRDAPRRLYPRAVLVSPRVTVDELRGKPAVINFWAGWCEPCRHESPQLERLWRSLHGRAGLVGVDHGDGVVSARAFLRSIHLTYPDLREVDGVFGERYGLVGLPETAINARGRIVLLRGPQTASTLHRVLTAAGMGASPKAS